VLTTSLEDLRRAERILIIFRSVGAVWSIFQVSLYHRLPWPPGLQETGFALVGVLVLGNLASMLAYRRAHTLRRAQWLAVATLTFDLVMASSFVWLFTFDEMTAVWVVLYVLPLEGALRFRLRGAMAAWAAAAVIYSIREVWGSQKYGYDLLWNSVTFRLGVGFLIGLVAGLMADDLLRQRQRLADALSQLRRQDEFRSDLVSSLASDARSPLAVILAEAAAKGVGGVRSRVRLFLPGGREHCYVWPPDALDDEGYDRTVTVAHRGEILGDIGVAKVKGEDITEADEQLLAGLASQASLALRNLRLAGELEERLEELRASRERIVTAQDRERRRIERDIHDGAQQQLVALAINLGLAKTLVAEEPEEATALLEQLKAEARETLETLRDLARGVFPPLLMDSGLVPALQAHIAKVGMGAEVYADSVATTRFDPQVEAAVYFCCREALQNASKHAPGADVSLRLVYQGGLLGFSVTDTGDGFDPAAVHEGSGLHNLADRLEALGGHLEVRSGPGQGTTVAGQVPAKALAPSDGQAAVAGASPLASAS
jgi:signal transduction histidine kinase